MTGLNNCTAFEVIANSWGFCLLKGDFISVKKVHITRNKIEGFEEVFEVIKTCRI